MIAPLDWVRSSVRSAGRSVVGGDGDLVSAPRAICLSSAGMRSVRRLARCDEPALVRKHDRLDAIAQRELGEHVGDVGLNRRVTYDEVIGDLRVGQAAREQPQNVELAWRELVERGRSHPLRGAEPGELLDE